MTLTADVQQSWHDGLVELYDIDFSLITGDPADILYLANQVKPNGTKIQWKGQTYEPLPISGTGFEKVSAGQTPQPSLTIANALGVFSPAIDTLGDLIGAKVTRRRTFGKYLDGEPAADPSQEFPLDVFYIEQKTSENAIAITWTLSSILDLEGVRLPRRLITQNYCQWKYRSSECGYTGGPVADERDRPTGSLSNDICGKRLQSCQLRFPNQSLPFGGFPGATVGQ
jgi:lambda family phage minor tail protein L